MSEELNFNPVIGIISYLPDEEKLRQRRIFKIQRLINQLNNFFPDIHIMVIAQNWKDFSGEGLDIEYHEEKMGICKARIALREKFLNSEYTHLIMVDDDLNLVGTKEGYNMYLNFLKKHPEQPLMIKHSLLWLLSISKKCYRETPMPDTDVETTRIFEDQLFTDTLKEKYICSYFWNNKLVSIDSQPTDSDSTWLQR